MWQCAYLVSLDGFPHCGNIPSQLMQTACAQYAKEADVVLHDFYYNSNEELNACDKNACVCLKLSSCTRMEDNFDVLVMEGSQRVMESVCLNSLRSYVKAQFLGLYYCTPLLSVMR